MPRTFTMSDAHMQAFSGQQQDRFTNEMLDYLKKYYPEKIAKMGEAAARQQIAAGITKAKSYHILLEEDVARYIQFMFAMAPDFDDSKQTPWAQPILSDRHLPAKAKLDQIAALWEGHAESRVRT